MKTRYVSLAAATLLLLTACNDFLEEDPKGALTPDQAYSTLDGLYSNAVMSIYNYIGGNSDSQGLQGTGRGVYDFNTLTTDEAIMPTRGGDWYDGGFWQSLYLHTWDAGEQSLKNTWEYLFSVVMRCNTYLEKIAAYEQLNGENATTQAYSAELRGVRAMYYFYILDLFGRAPIVTSTEQKSSSLTLAARSELFRFVTNELTAALEHLILSRSNQKGDYYGRFTSPVAYFLLAKLMLNAPVYLDDDWTDGTVPDGKTLEFEINGQTMNAWEACVGFCDRLGEFGYELESDFSHNFAVINEDSKENIFTIPMDHLLYSNWYTYFFRSRHYCHGAALGGASENGTSATLTTLRTFGYGTDEEDSRFRQTFYAGYVYENGEQVMMDDGITPLYYYPWDVALDITGTEHEKTAGARLAKYMTDPNANADGRACHNDIVLFRYADVLLMRAEANVRNGGDGSADFNAVRERVKASPRECTLATILEERELELAWEGWRRNDMVRYGTFCQAYDLRPQLIGEQNGYTSVFPIPEDILEMHPDWQQNPGYQP